MELLKSEKELDINHIDPPYWFVGMKNHHLQLMIYGKGVAGVSSVKSSDPAVLVERVVRLKSPNYLFVYLDLFTATPGIKTLCFDGHEVAYELKKREKEGEDHYSFSNADVIYLLMPDRFAQGKGHCSHVEGLYPYQENRTKPSLRHGGDLNGIREHLDYFCELGVTALWLTPVLENNTPDDPRGFSSYHGYSITNYYRIDPRLGSSEDYLNLIVEAHGYGLKILMDLVFNHCSIYHPWVDDSPSDDWFNAPEGLKEDRHPETIDTKNFLQTNYKLTPVIDPYASKVDKRETVEGWFVSSMPDLNLRNPHLRRYLIQNSKWWIEAGIDGIRMDTYPYANADAMAEWMQEVNEEYPNFNTVGETWVTQPAYTAAWQQDSGLVHQSHFNSHLKTVMDFALFDQMNKAKDEETDEWWQGLNRIYNTLCYDFLYPNPSNVLAFIDNHDTNRFLGKRKDVAVLKQALSILLIINRIPQIYYGTELLMSGTTEKTDGDVRKDFPGGFTLREGSGISGDSRAGDCFLRKGRTKSEQDMFAWLSRLLHWRQHNEIICHGRQIQFIPYKGLYVIARQWQNETVMLILNGTDHFALFPIKRYNEVIGNACKAVDVLSRHTIDLSADIQMKPRQTLILQF